MLNRLVGLLSGRQLSLFEAEPAPAPTAAPAPHDPAPRRAGKPPMAPAGRKDRELLLSGERVSYELTRASRRSIGFTVSEAGLRVAAPRWVSQAEIERALHHKSSWILRKLAEQQERAERQREARVQWADGCSLPYLGESLLLVLDPHARVGSARLDTGIADPQPSLAGVPRQTLYLGLAQSVSPEQISAAAQAWLQRQARTLFELRCAHYAPMLGVQMKRLRLSSAQTRWGSASADGSVRLNWRLIHLAPEVVDYVVVHELAHLREMNHSARFWAVVASVLPDYELARAQLRQVTIPGFEDEV